MNVLYVIYGVRCISFAYFQVDGSSLTKGLGKQWSVSTEHLSRKLWSYIAYSWYKTISRKANLMFIKGQHWAYRSLAWLPPSSSADVLLPLPLVSHAPRPAHKYYFRGQHTKYTKGETHSHTQTLTNTNKRERLVFSVLWPSPWLGYWSAVNAATVYPINASMKF